MRKIMINAGHGGSDPGATANGLREKDYTLQLSNALSTLAKANGYEVYNNRTTDTARSINADANTANNKGVDLVVEFHLNSNSGTPGAGAEVYYYSTSSKGLSLATAVSNSVAKAQGIKNRGAKTGDSLGIIRLTKAVAILIEVCFINNVTEMANLDVNKVAQATMDEINAYFGVNGSNSSSNEQNTNSGTNTSTQTKSLSEVAKEVIAGKWGNGNDRKAKLENAGYNYSEVQAEVNKQLGATSTAVSYYPAYTGASQSIVDALKAIGVDNSMTNRKKIAAKNGIGNYSGTATQNTTMLTLLKKGNLVRV